MGYCVLNGGGGGGGLCEARVYNWTTLQVEADLAL